MHFSLKSNTDCSSLLLTTSIREIGNFFTSMLILITYVVTLMIIIQMITFINLDVIIALFIINPSIYENDNSISKHMQSNYY